MQHADVLRERHHGAHDMFDQQDGGAVGPVEIAEHLHDLVGLSRPQPCHDFVEEKQLRLRSERACHFKALAVGRVSEEAGKSRFGPSCSRSRIVVATLRAPGSLLSLRKAPTMTFSRTESPAKGFTIWNVRPIPAAHT